MGISFGSINTGLPKDIVQQLMEAERIPVKNLETKKSKVQEQLKLVDEITGKVREIFNGTKELSGTKGFQAMKLESGDPNVVFGTVDPGLALEGTWMVEVQRLAHKTSVVTNGFPDKNETEVGIGYIKYTDTNGTTRDIFIDGENNTLEKVAKTINSKGAGLRASIITDRADKENPYRLMLSGTAIGEAGNLKIPTLYFLDGDQDMYVDFEREAENGLIKIDGVEMEIDDNKLKDVIPGVTLELRSAAPGKEVAVSVGRDSQIIVGKVKSFVDQMNAALQFIQTQNQLNDKSDTTRTLGGDSILRSVESRLREVVLNPVYGTGSSMQQLSDVGISFNRSGLLEFQEEKFSAAIARDLDGVRAFFVGDGFATGFVPRIKNSLGLVLDGVNGPLPQRKKGFETKIKEIDQQIERKERVLAQHELTLKNKFAKLEETMARLKAQGQQMQARLGGGGGGNDGSFNLGG